MYSKKFSKISTKLLRSSFPVMLQTFLTRRALKRNLSTQRNTWRALKRHLSTRRSLKGHTKGTPKVLAHSRHSGTRAFEAFRHSKGTWALKAVEHLGTQTLGTRALEGHLGTQALRHLGTRGTLFSRLFFVHSNVIVR